MFSVSERFVDNKKKKNRYFRRNSTLSFDFVREVIVADIFLAHLVILSSINCDDLDSLLANVSSETCLWKSELEAYLMLCVYVTSIAKVLFKDIG